MSVFQYKSGLGNSAAYQVSARPYILRGTTTGGSTVDQISFDSVTNFIQVSSSGDVRLGFSELGVTTSDNYFVLNAGVSDIYDWRITSVFLSGSGATVDYEIRAGVTTISSTELTTNWSGSAGIG